MDMPLLKKRYHKNLGPLIFTDLLQIAAGCANKKAGPLVTLLSYQILYINLIKAI